MHDIKKKSASLKAFKSMFFAIMITLLVIVIIGLILNNNREVPKARNGVLDLSYWNFEKQGTIMLNGEWSFYWNKSVNDLKNIKPDIYAKVPDVWNNYIIDGKKLPAFGFATYSLRVTGAQCDQIAFRIPPNSTAYEFYIDGKLLAKNGVFSDEALTAVPEYEPKTVTFSPSTGDFTITMFVSNYVYARGGAWYPTILGTASKISCMNRLVNFRDLMLIGSFITMSMFCICMFFLAKRKFSIILFAILALITALRTTIYGDYLLASFGVSFRFLIIVEYITLIWMPTLIALFILSLAKKNNFKKFAAAISIGAGIITIFVVIAPVHIFTRYTVLIEILEIGIALYSLFCLLKSNNQSKKAIALGAAVLIASGVYDVLYQNCVVGGFAELSPVGFFVMLNTWGVVLAKDYTNLTEYAKASLDKAQTAEIAFLEAQIKPHFLYNALNVLASLCRLDSEYAEKLTIELSKYLHYTFEFKNLSKTISFSNELDFIETYVKIEKARFVNEFDVVYDLCDTSALMVPPLSIQPLIENAIRHGIRKKEQFGTVVLKVEEEKDRYIIDISDDGAGIEPSKLERLKKGLRDENDGVGLINVKQRIKSLYKADFLIKSELGRGTRICVTLPKNIREARLR